MSHQFITCRSVTNREKSARLPYRGVPVSTEGQEHVPSSVGPMARSLDAIHAAFKSLIDLKPWEFDARCAAIPWREDVYQDAISRPLVIGVLFDDEVVRPHPPITRVLRSAVEALRNAGHHIVDWNAQLHAECVEVMVSRRRSYVKKRGAYAVARSRINSTRPMVAKTFERLSRLVASLSSSMFRSSWTAAAHCRYFNIGRLVFSSFIYKNHH